MVINIHSKNYLKPTKEKITKYKLFGFDIETYGDKNKFLMGSIVNGTEKYVFWEQKLMQDFILKSRKLSGAVIFATNLSFDFLALFGDDYRLLSKFRIINKGSDFIFIKRTSNRRTIKFMDTFSFFKVSVKQLGKIVGVPKLEKPDTLGDYVNKNSSEGRYLEKYNVQDSYISYLFAEFLQKNFNDLGSTLKCTVASTSMNIFKRNYLKHWIMQPKKQVIEEQFNAYYGGRVESFYRGYISSNNNNPYFLYDINSLFPHVMREKNYPNPNSIKLGVDLSKEGYTYCNIRSPENLYYPLLPHRTEDNKLLFPLGEFRGWHSNIELRKAIELGYIINPIKGYHYTMVFNPFKDFITDLYNKRLDCLKKGSATQLIYKLCMNSNYGKWGQRLYYQDLLFADSEKDNKKFLKVCEENKQRHKIGLKSRYEIDITEKYVKTKDGNEYFKPIIYYVRDTESENYPKFINPIMAIYTTSYARLELYNWIEKVLKMGKKVLYCDTDSLITDAILPTGEKLGQLKKEIDIKEGVIVKPKFYYLQDSDNSIVVKSKGMSNLKTLMKFKKTIRTREYSYVKFTKFKESIRRDLDFNEKIKIRKIIDLEDNKREWDGLFNERKIEKSKPLIIK